jgi:hypothetical protein
MALVLLVFLGAAAALAMGGLARRAVLGNRMDCSFETLKQRTRQNASWDDVVIRRAPVQVDSIKGVRLGPSPTTNTQEVPAELRPAS